MNPTISFQSLRSKALAMLTRREHSENELHQKLLELGATDSEILLILTEFKEKNWQSDTRFCQAFIRSHARKGHGEVVIKQELKQRGITNAELFNTELEEYDWFALAQETRCKKFGADLPSERKEQARQYRFLQYRGFNNEQCWHALKHND
mgnify:FL=1